MPTNRKYISITEFRDKGYLQEVNRRFFHPLGLALSVEREDGGEWELHGIWDVRHDPEGVVFDGEYIVSEEAQEKATFVTNEFYVRGNYRQEHFGYSVQPIDDIMPEG